MFGNAYRAESVDGFSNTPFYFLEGKEKEDAAWHLLRVLGKGMER